MRSSWTLFLILLSGVAFIACDEPPGVIGTLDGGSDAFGCADGVQNGDETDVDCGGTCARCGDGQACERSSDCLSGICESGACAAAACGDAIANGDETGVDCGGPVCPSCRAGEPCQVAQDCESGVCDRGICSAPRCDDEVINGDEADVDCGGRRCFPCGLLAMCSSGDDCLLGVCVDGQCSTCTDGVRGGGETDVDCGARCGPCGVGLRCASADDCVSHLCGSDGTCLDPMCRDGVQNGDETDVDCGGSCEICELGEGCASDDDCTIECVHEVCQPGHRRGFEVDLIARFVDVATDAAGNVYITGDFGRQRSAAEETVDFGDGDPVVRTVPSYFLVSYDATGALRWKVIGELSGPTDRTVTRGLDVLVTPSGTVTMMGSSSSGSIELGGTRTTVSSRATFFAQYGSDGAFVRARVIQRTSTANEPELDECDLDGAGRIYCVGSALGYVPVDLGGIVLAPLPGRHSNVMIMASYDTDLSLRWARNDGYPDPYGNGAHAIAVATDGSFYISGWLTGVDWGNGVELSIGEMDPSWAYSVPFLAAFDALGRAQWARSFEHYPYPALTTNGGFGTSVVVDGAHVYLIAKNYGAFADVDTTTLMSHGGEDILLVRCTTAGAGCAGRMIGGGGEDTPTDGALVAGQLALVGFYRGSMDLGWGVWHPGVGEAFLALMSPDDLSVDRWSRYLRPPQTGSFVEGGPDTKNLEVASAPGDVFYVIHGGRLMQFVP